MTSFVCGFKSVTTKELKQVANLLNKIIGYVKEMINAENENPASSLPIHGLIGFDEKYIR